MNFIENCTPRAPRLFADDICIVSEASSLSDLELRLNHQFKNVASWVSVSKLTVNPTESYMKYYPLKTALNLWLRTIVSTLQPAKELNPVFTATELPMFVRALRALRWKKIFSAF